MKPGALMSDFREGIEQFLQSFSPEEVAVTRVVFQRLLDGHATRPDGLAGALGMTPAVVAVAVDRLVDRGTIAVDPETGDVVGARGLSLGETPHRLTLNGRRLYAFCAVDAVGIPAALEADARVESRCHGCRTAVVLTLTRGIVTGAPSGVLVWAAELDLTRPLHTYT